MLCDALSCNSDKVRQHVIRASAPSCRSGLFRRHVIPAFDEACDYNNFAKHVIRVFGSGHLAKRVVLPAELSELCSLLRDCALISIAGLPWAGRF